MKATAEKAGYDTMNGELDHDKDPKVKSRELRDEGIVQHHTQRESRIEMTLDPWQEGVETFQIVLLV